MKKLNNSNNLIFAAENDNPRRNFSGQRIIFLLSIAAILIGVVLIFSSVFGFNLPLFTNIKQSLDFQKDEDFTETKLAVSVKTEKIFPKNISHNISASAVTKPLNEVKVSPKMSGKVVALYFKEGDFVQGGQVIAQLEQDQTLLANYNTAFNNYQIAQKNLEQTLLSAQKDIEAAEIGVTTAEENLKAAKQNLENTLKQTSVDLSNTYQTAKQQSDSALLSANNALTTIKSILDSYSYSKTGTYYEGFPTSDSQSFYDLMTSYPKAKSAYYSTLDYYNSIKQSDKPAEIGDLLKKVEDLLDKTSIALDDMRRVLASGITNSRMTAGQLEAAKSSVYAAQAAIDGSITGIQAIEQKIASLKIGRTTAEDSARSAVDLAEKQLSSAKKNLEGIQAKAKIQINSAKAQLEAAKGQLDVISAQLANTIITAPVSGIINQVYTETGEMIVAGQPIIDLVNIKGIEIEVFLTEFDIGKVFVGQKAIVNLAAYPNEEFVGRVYYVSSVADPISKKFSVKIQLENRDGRIKAGMVAQVRIITYEEENVITVPRKAVFIENDQEKIYLINKSLSCPIDNLKHCAQIEIRNIKTEPLDENELKVIEGLSEGEEIIINGNYDLKEGELVIVRNQ
ncbi:efflux RND transporter periplasmic adaptor subunit [bacterium]|nr:efflux RND transporter periplasmic adaptor subunit [bacterium]